ncbi:ribonuclease HI [Bradyrhizobium sp. USDA 4369]
MNEKNTNWWQEEMHFRVKAMVSYEAWISATDRPQADHSAGRSACAWELRETSGTNAVVHMDAKISESNESDEQRGYVAAALGVISCLTNSAVTIYAASDYVVEGLNRNAKLWQAQGWLEPKGKRRKNAELWELILKLEDERGLSIKAVRRSRSDDQILDAVHNRAIAARDAKIL